MRGVGCATVVPPPLSLRAGACTAAHGCACSIDAAPLLMPCAVGAAPLLLRRMALCVQVYLKMDRPDLAEKQVRFSVGALGSPTLTLHCPHVKVMRALGVPLALPLCHTSIRILFPSQVKAMSAVDDDATLTQLAAAWLGLHQARGRCCAMQGGSERQASGTLWEGPLGTGPCDTVECSAAPPCDVLLAGRRQGAGGLLHLPGGAAAGPPTRGEACTLVFGCRVTNGGCTLVLGFAIEDACSCRATNGGLHLTLGCAACRCQCAARGCWALALCTAAGVLQPLTTLRCAPVQHTGAGRQVCLDGAPAQRAGGLPDAHGALGGCRGRAAAGEVLFLDSHAVAFCFGWLGMGAAGHPGRPRETWRTRHGWHPGRNPRMSEC